MYRAKGVPARKLQHAEKAIHIFYIILFQKDLLTIFSVRGIS